MSSFALIRPLGLCLWRLWNTEWSYLKPLGLVRPCNQKPFCGLECQNNTACSQVTLTVPSSLDIILCSHLGKHTLTLFAFCACRQSSNWGSFMTLTEVLVNEAFVLGTVSGNRNTTSVRLDYVVAILCNSLTFRVESEIQSSTVYYSRLSFFLQVKWYFCLYRHRKVLQFALVKH